MLRGAAEVPTSRERRTMSWFGEQRSEVLIHFDLLIQVQMTTEFGGRLTRRTEPQLRNDSTVSRLEDTYIFRFESYSRFMKSSTRSLLLNADMACKLMAPSYKTLILLLYPPS